MSRHKARRRYVACVVVPEFLLGDMKRDLARDLAEIRRAWSKRKERVSSMRRRPTEADIERSMRAAEEAARRMAARRRPRARV